MSADTPEKNKLRAGSAEIERAILSMRDDFTAERLMSDAAIRGLAMSEARFV
ncbi:MAG: hypothetical protein LBR53_01895 [Deltaproteobacteria bacterium]|jgi:hypothetical protein|nr:hypothetical protein [Deltaproteobacteria bacterium]